MVKIRSLSISAPSYLFLVDLVRRDISSYEHSIERYEEYLKEHDDDDNDAWMKDYSYQYRRDEYNEANSKLPSLRTLLLELYGFGG